MLKGSDECRYRLPNLELPTKVLRQDLLRAELDLRVKSIYHVLTASGAESQEWCD